MVAVPNLIHGEVLIFCRPIFLSTWPFLRFQYGCNQHTRRVFELFP